TSWSKVSIIDAGHFDNQTAYAAVNRFRLDDLRPHVYRTHDGGKTWTEIVKGLPDDPVNVVREDPVRKGLLFAGSERAVYVSFNDGDEWQPLRLNMPATSIRDLVVHRDDIVVGTHGRSFWILDDITPLRQMDEAVASSDALLFASQQAFRVQRNANTDTPLPPEEPAGQNPPDGAIINYYLKQDATEPVVLEVFDRAGKLVRRFRSDDKPEPVDEKELNVPTYWVRPARVLPAKAGMQRFVWDLHYAEPKARSHEYPISAIYMDTPRGPLGPSVLPGQYTLKLTVAGHTYTRTLDVAIDPRVKTTRAGLEQQLALSQQTAEGMNATFDALEAVGKLRAQLKDLRARQGLAPALAESLAALDAKAAALEGGGTPRGPGSAPAPANLSQLHTQLSSLLDVLQQSDAAPTTQAVAASSEFQRQLRELLQSWQQLKSKDVEAVNAQLRAANLPTLAL
ncbi:MAG: WD40/YVTN/BNR-like repeat-containing protein, partial [Pyrinomonadaceae bacterium]